MKIIDAAILTVAFIFNAFILDAEWQSLAIAIGGSLSGSVILAYFRRDSRKVEQVFKVLCSAIGGLVLGTVLQEYLQIESQGYRLGLFFMASMLALVVLKSLLSLTEKNSGEIVRGILQRVFNLQLKEEKTRRRVEKLEGVTKENCDVLDQHIAKVAPVQAAIVERIEKLEEDKNE